MIGNNFDQLLRYLFTNAVKIASAFNFYLDNKMMMITMVTIKNQKYPIVAT